MGRTKVRFDNVGRMKTTYTVNFDDHQSILDIIEPLMENTRTKKEILKLGLGIIDHIHEEDTIDDGIEHVTKLLGSLSPSNQNSVNVSNKMCMNLKIPSSTLQPMIIRHVVTTSNKTKKQD